MKKLLVVIAFLALALVSQTAFAQHGLNWDGQTGGLLTPFAYTAPSGKAFLGKPEVSAHFLAAGDVLGYDTQFSVTEGFAKRFEIGFTQSFSALGSTTSSGGVLNLSANSAYTLGVVKPDSDLFSNGYTTIHGKVTLVNENAGKTKWVPAIAVGAVGRFGEQRLSYYTAPSAYMPGTQKNGDFYVVATKIIPQVKKFPVVLNLGEKVTDASVHGIVGNAGNLSGTGARWQGRLFGAAAVIVHGPAKSLLIIGSEAEQEPKYVQGLNDFVNGAANTLAGPGIPKPGIGGITANIPTSVSYFVRIVPTKLTGLPLQVDFALVQAAGQILNDPGVVAIRTDARNKFGMGVSYKF